MKIKLDENMPTALLTLLSSHGHDPDNAQAEGLGGCGDDVIWRAAQEAGRLFITQDLDFSDVRKFVPGSHCGILVFRLSEPGWLALVNRAEAVFAIERLEDWRGCFVVVTDRKVRVRRPVATEN